MTKKRILSMVLVLIMGFSIMYVGAPVASAAAVPFSNGRGVKITKSNQVVDSITVNGVKVDAIFRPYDYTNGKDSTYSCAAFVSKFYKKVYNISVSNLLKTTATPLADKSCNFTKTGSPKQGDILRDNQNVHWGIVKSVSSNGMVTIIQQNAWKDNAHTQAWVEAQTSQSNSRYTFFRLNGYNQTLTFTSPTINWPTGKSANYTIKKNGSTVSNTSFNWKSSNTKVATVNSSGKLTSVGVGTATITATNKSNSKEVVTGKVTVYDPAKVTGIKLNKTSLTWPVRATGKLTATISPSTATNKNVAWSSSNTKVATVDVNGNVKAVGVGTATITCKSKQVTSVTAKCTINVKKQIEFSKKRSTSTSKTGVNIACNVINSSQLKVTEYGYYIWNSTKTKIIKTGKDVGSFTYKAPELTYKVSGLTKNTKYYYQFYLKVDGSNTYGSGMVEFKTAK